MKTARVAVLSFIAIIIIACIVGSVAREQPKCTLDSLVLSDSDMPAGWRTQWTITPPALERKGAEQAYGITWLNDGGVAQHKIYQYSNRWLAAFHVHFNSKLYFPPGSWVWSDVEDIGQLSLQADQLWVKCGKSDDPYLDDRCAAVLRYGPYVSDFDSAMAAGKMSLEEFKQTLLKIDTLFGRCIR